MNIKQAAEQSGVPSQNIRFYEKEGLLAPMRRPGNGYRDYSDQDLRTLKLIRTLRMLDMPLPQIRRVLAGTLTLPEAAKAQRTRLVEQSLRLEAAIRFCGELAESGQSAGELDVDSCLRRMTEPPQPGYCTHWLADYRAVARAEHEKQFTFLPDTPVTNPREFTDALLAYGAQHGLELVVEQEGMCPRFTIDGVEYRAVRRYTHCRGVPVASVRCTVAHPEDFEPDVAPGRRRWQRLLHHAWPVLAALAVLAVCLWDRLALLLTTWWGWGLLLCFAAAAVSGAVYNYYMFYNENGKGR